LSETKSRLTKSIGFLVSNN